MDRGGFGRKIRELRKERGLGLRELARRVGIDHTRLSKIERGLRPPPAPATILRLAWALEVEPLTLARLGGLPDELLAALAEKGSVNLLRGRVIDSSEGLALVQIGSTQLEIVSDAGAGEVALGIRPEEITLHLGEGPQSSARNGLPGVIEEILPHGNYYHAVIDCRNFRLKVAVTARSIAGLGLRPGVEVFASFKATAVRIFKQREGDSLVR
ncbi:MAG: helix-turn-helix domain-containing protein [Candidatus Bipolaricaulia bacterium]